MLYDFMVCGSDGRRLFTVYSYTPVDCLDVWHILAHYGLVGELVYVHSFPRFAADTIRGKFFDVKVDVVDYGVV